MIAAVVLYFSFASVVLAVLLLPNLRAQAFAWVQRLRSAEPQRDAPPASHLAEHMRRTGARQRAWLLGGTLVLLAAPLLTLSLRGFVELEGYDHRRDRAVSEQVAALLAGEQLVPPPALPPELFATPEVEQAHPLAVTASREWALLDTEFRKRLLVVYRVMQEKHGYEMVLLEGYRSPARQEELAALGGNVTRAKAFESWHQYGLAADSAFRRAGRVVVSEKDAWAARGYELFGQVAAEAGLTWGGSWKSIRDLGHVEMPRAGVMQRRGGHEEPTAAHAH